MTVVGEAHVIIKAITDSVKSDIEDAFNSVDAKGAGKSMGQTFGDEFAKAAKKAMGDALKDVFDDAKVKAKAAGESGGKDYAAGFNDKLVADLDIDKAFRGMVGKMKAHGEKAAGDWGVGFLKGARPAIYDALDKAFDDTVVRAKRAGTDAATNFGSGFVARAQNVVVVDWKVIEKGADVAGVNAGQTFAKNFNKGVKGQIVIDWDVLVNDAATYGVRAGRALGNGMNKGSQGPFNTLRNTLKGLFSSFGGGNNRGSIWAMFGNPPDFAAIGNSARAASKAFTNLYAAGAILGPAIAGLVGMFSSAASGLFAMAAAAAQAGPALLVLPGIMGAVLQAGLGLKLAFQGIGDAIGAAMKETQVQTGATARAAAAAQRAIEAAQIRLARAQEDGARNVAEAQERVAEAYEDAAERSRDALLKVRDAERDLKDAQNDARNAQLALNRAREEAIEDLQQLAFSAEDAALAEESAALRLEEAYERMVEAQADLAPDDRDRREAELAFKEAELGLRRAKDRNLDLAKAQDEAAKSGVNGHSKVVDAQNELINAQNRVKEQEFALAEARRDQAIVARENQERIREAIEGVVDAQRNAQRAIDDANRALSDARERLSDARDGTEEYNAALDKLTASQRAFVEHLKDKGYLELGKTLREAVAAGFLPRLTEQIDAFMAAGGFNVVKEGLEGTGVALGSVTTDIGNFLSSAEFLGRLKTIMEANNETIKLAGPILVDILDIISAVAVAIQPLVTRFVEWIAKIVHAKAELLGTDEGIKGMEAGSKKAGDIAAQLGRIIGNLGGAFGNLGASALPAGEGLIDSFERATERFEKFTARVRGDGSANKFFTTAAENLRSIGDLVVVIGREFIGLGDNPNIGKFAESLIPAAENIGDIGDALIDASPALGELATKLTQLFEDLTDAGSLKAFLDTLSFLLDIVLKITGSGAFQALFTTLGPILAVFRALAFAAMPFIFFLKVVLGSVLKILGPLLKLFGFLRKIYMFIQFLGGFIAVASAIGGAIVSALGAIGAAAVAIAGFAATVIAPIALIGLTLVILYRRVEWFRDAVNFVWDQIVAGFMWLRDQAVQVFDDFIFTINDFGRVMGELYSNYIEPAIQAIIDGFMWLWDVLWGNSIIPDILDAFKAGFTWLGEFLGKIMDAIKVVFTAAFNAIMWAVENVFLPLFRNVVVPYFQGLVAIYTAIWDGIKKGFDLLGAGLRLVWDNVIKPAFQLGWDFIKFMWEGVKVIFGLFKAGFELLGKGLQWVWDNVIKPAFQLGKDFIGFMWNGIKVYFDLIKAGFGLVGDGIRFVWNEIIRPTLNFLKDAFQAVWDKATAAVDGVKTKFGEVGSFLSEQYTKYIDPVVTDIKDAFESIKTKAGDVVDGVKEIFNKLKDAPSQGIKNLIGNFNRYLIGNLNKVLGVFNFNIPEIPVPQFATGGYVRGKGGPKEDKILARLSNGEYVVNAAATRANRPILEAINRGNGKSAARSVAPIGGIPGIPKNMPKIGAIVDKVTLSPEEVAAKTKELFEKGVAKALEDIVKPFFSTYVKPTDKMPWMLPHLALGGFLEKIKDWGDDADKALPDEAILGPGRSGAYGGVLPHVAAVGDLVKKMYPAISAIGGRDNRPNKSDHPMGLALDFMVGRNKTLGDSISQFGIDNWDVLSLKYMIWYNRIMRGKGKPWTAYTHPLGRTDDTSMHRDHPHWSFLGSPTAAGVAAMNKAGGTGAVSDPREGASQSGQLGYARTIASVGKAMGASQRDVIIALMTAMQESGLRNINYGDRDSVGLFQQRPSQGWGTAAEIMNPAYAARKFFEVLLRISRRSNMSLTQAAQAVQRSAYPDAYAKHEPYSRSLLKQLGVFDTGGLLGNGNLALNLSGRPERVLNPRQTQAFDAVFARDDGLIRQLIETSQNGPGAAEQSRASVAREERMISLLNEIADRVSSGDQIIVQPSPGMDEREIALEVSRRVAAGRRRGV